MAKLPKRKLMKSLATPGNLAHTAHTADLVAALAAQTATSPLNQIRFRPTAGPTKPTVKNSFPSLIFETSGLKKSDVFLYFEDYEQNNFGSRRYGTLTNVGEGVSDARRIPCDYGGERP